MSTGPEAVFLGDAVGEFVTTEESVIGNRHDRYEVVQWLGEREAGDVASDVTTAKANRQSSLDIDDLLV
ncbi:hypothetical protein NDI56_18935 [Haloarcula sp. S1CR25-12]|uniref:Uncharacterized protein n=1 Tax=Haloarcula saliterrae TaxID=2950534 RepID=A0ABU2FGV7_9EURY|nr:hypothetical protein [Haloarcula sp. S1CR25-12]MDS0261482.1 hypothetical protein [Haloarcula sp. S1CR25-12]